MSWVVVTVSSLPKTVGDTHRPGGLGEPDHAVEPVVIGERQRRQSQAGGLLHELFGGRSTVEEAEV